MVDDGIRGRTGNGEQSITLSAIRGTQASLGSRGMWDSKSLPDCSVRLSPDRIKPVPGKLKRMRTERKKDPPESVCMMEYS